MTLDWYGLYGGGWQGEIVPTAFAHPAKFARGLIRKIYIHAIEQGYFAEGDKVVDPFGGVALGAIDAMYNGLYWTGVELEPRFVALGNENIALWNRRYAGKLARWGSAELLQGDSRRLCEIVGEASGVVSSPPYVEQVIRARDIGKPGFMQGATRGEHCFDTYGTTLGQLGSMRPGNFDAAVSSPPFCDSMVTSDDPNYAHKFHGPQGKYGITSGNIGNESSDTFWLSARTIVEQVHLALKPSGYAAWVVKSFVRNKALVDFPAQWEHLCQSCGFVNVETVRAWLVEDKGTQYGLDGQRVERKIARKSFFRRLAEKNGSPPIDYEVVLFMRKSK
jgi:hypothetical protein